MSRDISGVLVQLPLPSHLDQEQVINLIGPEKDVDGLHPFNIGSLALKRHTPYFISCTPLGVVSILQEILGSTEAISGRKITLIGRSNIVGMPLYLLLNKYNAFVQVMFSKNSEAEIQSTVEQSDIVISACGVAGLIRSQWLKQDAIVIDVGISYIQNAENEKPVISGDVEFNELTLQRCSQITPVPGGVGPMTITMLLSNLVESWELQNQSQLLDRKLLNQAGMKSPAVEFPVACEHTAHQFSHNLNMQI